MCLLCLFVNSTEEGQIKGDNWVVFFLGFRLL